MIIALAEEVAHIKHAALALPESTGSSSVPDHAQRAHTNFARV